MPQSSKIIIKTQVQKKKNLQEIRISAEMQKF